MVGQSRSLCQGYRFVLCSLWLTSKKTVSFGTFSCDWLEDTTHRVTATFDEGVVTGLLMPPFKIHSHSTLSFPGEGRGKKLFFSHFFFSKQWARKRENSHCRASGTLYLSVGWKALQQNERMRGLFTRAKLNEKGEGIKWKSSLLPTKLD